MKRLVTNLSCTTMLVGMAFGMTDPALAADVSLPLGQSAPPPTVFTWTGFYGGLVGGYGHLDAKGHARRQTGNSASTSFTTSELATVTTKEVTTFSTTEVSHVTTSVETTTIVTQQTTTGTYITTGGDTTDTITVTTTGSDTITGTTTGSGTIDVTTTGSDTITLTTTSPDTITTTGVDTVTITTTGVETVTLTTTGVVTDTIVDTITSTLVNTLTQTIVQTVTTGVVVAGAPIFDVSDFSTNDESWFLGAQAGYDQAVGPLVVGGVVDLAGSGMSGTANLGYSTTAKAQLDWFGTARLRVGVPINRFLLYGTGGLAVGGLKISLQSPFGSGSDRFTKVGWAAGAGLSYAVTNNVVVDLSYLHLGFGSHNFSGSYGSGKVRVSSDLVRLGISYKF